MPASGRVLTLSLLISLRTSSTSSSSQSRQSTDWAGSRQTSSGGRAKGEAQAEEQVDEQLGVRGEVRGAGDEQHGLHGDWVLAELAELLALLQPASVSQKMLEKGLWILERGARPFRTHNVSSKNRSRVSAGGNKALPMPDDGRSALKAVCQWVSGCVLPVFKSR